MFIGRIEYSRPSVECACRWLDCFCPSLEQGFHTKAAGWLGSALVLRKRSERVVRRVIAASSVFQSHECAVQAACHSINKQIIRVGRQADALFDQEGCCLSFCRYRWPYCGAYLCVILPILRIIPGTTFVLVRSMFTNHVPHQNVP